MIELGRCSCLSNEPLLRAFISGRFWAQKFYGHFAVELRVFRQIDFTHPARTEFIHDSVMGNGLRDHRANTTIPWRLTQCLRLVGLLHLVRASADLTLISDLFAFAIKLDHVDAVRHIADQMLAEVIGSHPEEIIRRVGETLLLCAKLVLEFKVSRAGVEPATRWLKVN